MKILVLLLLISLPKLANSQIIVSDSLAQQSDSALVELNKFLSDYAKEMSNWSPKKKRRFKKIFIMKRGNIKIPKRPIKWED
jgi:hypothetical protein